MTTVGKFEQTFPVNGAARLTLTTKLQALFFDVVNGRAEQYREWLTPVK